jgi:hypothetical protein
MVVGSKGFFESAIGDWKWLAWLKKFKVKNEFADIRLISFELHER